MMADISAKCECNMLHVPGSVRVSLVDDACTRPPARCAFFVILVLEALRDRAGTGNELVTALSGLRATRLNSICFGKWFGRTGPARSNDRPAAAERTRTRRQPTQTRHTTN